MRVENLETCMETKADKAGLDDTEARVTSCEGQILGLAKDISTLSKQIDLVRTESDEKDKHTKNLIFRGKPKSDTGSDLDLVNSILKGNECPNIVVENLTKFKNVKSCWFSWVNFLHTSWFYIR